LRLSFARSIAIVFALPVLAHAHVLLGFFVSDPLYRFGGLASTTPGLLPGGATIDPNAGFVDQALTARAMHLVFSGHLPWWNSLEGLGAPLAGEMQSSAFFPFSPLVLLPNGNLILEVLLSIFAGIGMLFLLRRLGLSPWPTLVGAILFQMCGTFSWMSGAWTYSIPWLPFLAYGIEIARTRGHSGLRGSAIIAACVAMLILSGFIETSYFEGLVSVGWTVARLPREPWRFTLAYALRVMLGGAIGLALTAPVIDAFAQTLLISYVAGHDASSVGARLPAAALLQKLVPYAYGPIFASHVPEINSIWGSTGGYVGFMPVVLGVAALCGKRHASVRILCATVVALGFAAMLGGPLQHLVLLIPAVKYSAYFRYIDPSISFALSVLAAISLHDMLVGGRLRGRIVTCAALMVGLAIVAYGLGQASGAIAGATALDSDLGVWPSFSRLAIFALSAAVGLSMLFKEQKVAAVVVGVAACLEALVFIVIPTLSYPSSATIGLGGIHYLQRHRELDRVYSLGPLQPNYGSYYGFAYLNYNDLPIPFKTVTYIKEHLDSTADPVVYIPNRNRSPDDQRLNFMRNIDAFERVGVKYVLAGSNDPIPDPSAIRKFQDSTMAIYELPHPGAYFSATGCRIDATSREALTATCAGERSLCRLELNAPGWTADVDGRSVATGTCGDVFQSVPLPRGVSHIVFRYAPPFLTVAMVLAAFGFVALCYVLVLVAVGRKRAPTAA
jgi:hypothetical protein